jgi:hypothetical protein
MMMKGLLAWPEVCSFFGKLEDVVDDARTDVGHPTQMK